MNQEKIVRKAEATARKLRREWERGNADPLFKEANKAIMSLLGIINSKEEAT